MWEEREDLKGKVAGTLVSGDPSVPVTTRWNRWFLRKFVWRWIRFSLPTDLKGKYQVGYIPLGSETPIVKKALASNHAFQMRIGHEACRFFAVDQRGHEIPLFTDGQPKEKWPGMRAH